MRNPSKRVDQQVSEFLSLIILPAFRVVLFPSPYLFNLALKNATEPPLLPHQAVQTYPEVLEQDRGMGVDIARAEDLLQCFHALFISASMDSIPSISLFIQYAEKLLPAS